MSLVVAAFEAARTDPAAVKVVLEPEKDHR